MKGQSFQPQHWWCINSSSHGPRDFIHHWCCGRGSRCPWQFPFTGGGWCIKSCLRNDYSSSLGWLLPRKAICEDVAHLETSCPWEGMVHGLFGSDDKPRWANWTSTLLSMAAFLVTSMCPCAHTLSLSGPTALTPPIAL